MTQRKPEAAAQAAGAAVPVEQEPALEFEPVDEQEFVLLKVARGRSVVDHSGREKRPGEHAKVRNGKEAERLVRLGYLVDPNGEVVVPAGPRVSFE